MPARLLIILTSTAHRFCIIADDIETMHYPSADLLQSTKRETTQFMSYLAVYIIYGEICT